MKKLSTAKYLSLLTLLSLLGGRAEARHYEDDGYASESRDGCMSSCYECGCNPLYCGAWDLQVDGGVEPIVWRNREPWTALDCSDTPPVFDLVQAPKFSRLYRVPWVVGGQVGYAYTDNARVYLEFNYQQANRKHDVELLPIDDATTSFVLNAGRFKLWDGYVGARYYWDRWCDRVSFYLGGKIGFAVRLRSRYENFTLGDNALVEFDDTNFSHRDVAVVAGGADFGFDICFWGNWSVVIQGSILCNSGPYGARNIPTTLDTISYFSVGNVLNELRFPVTGGLRYSF